MLTSGLGLVGSDLDPFSGSRSGENGSGLLGAIVNVKEWPSQESEDVSSCLVLMTSCGEGKCCSHFVPGRVDIHQETMALEIIIRLHVVT